ncbi:MAG: biotin/lipoyl-binding protein [Bacteroidales bacterium]|nr:biotin/lipoyl-binding protein [Bacteroidales bacterium]
MKKFKFNIHGNNYNVEINDVERNTANVEVNGTCYIVELEHEVKKIKTPTLTRSAVKSQKDMPKMASATFKINCPLPGTIVSVLVSEGAEVDVGDALVIYEAMKMENKVLAEKKGIVRNIQVKAGDSILQEQLLLEIY